LRRLLTECAPYLIGPFGQARALQRGGRHLAACGGKNARVRAATAVARKLALLWHPLGGHKRNPYPSQKVSKRLSKTMKTNLVITPFFDDGGAGWADEAVR